MALAFFAEIREMSENMQIFLPTNLNTTIKKQIVVTSFYHS